MPPRPPPPRGPRPKAAGESPLPPTLPALGAGHAPRAPRGPLGSSALAGWPSQGFAVARAGPGSPRPCRPQGANHAASPWRPAWRPRVYPLQTVSQKGSSSPLHRRAGVGQGSTLTVSGTTWTARGQARGRSPGLHPLAGPRGPQPLRLRWCQRGQGSPKGRDVGPPAANGPALWAPPPCAPAGQPPGARPGEPPPATSKGGKPPPHTWFHLANGLCPHRPRPQGKGPHRLSWRTWASTRSGSSRGLTLRHTASTRPCGFTRMVSRA